MNQKLIIEQQEMKINELSMIVRGVADFLMSLAEIEDARGNEETAVACVATANSVMVALEG